MKRRLLKYLLVLVAILIVAEIGLRIFLDNEQRVVYQEDAFCEYRLVPNQNVVRFHNHYTTNEYGMRSPVVNSNDKKRILLLGDSVLNGGTKIDQAGLLNYILKENLDQYYDFQTGVYNISAGSWGPENAYRFLEHYINFEFDLMILLFSSDDYHDNMHFRKVVGTEPAWPADQPWLALTDLYTGFLAPKFETWFGSPYDYLEGFDDSAVNPGWDLFLDYAVKNNKPLVFYHHPNTGELNKGTYNEEGLLLNSKMTNAGAVVINGIGVESSADYLDNIHVSQHGHTLIAARIFDVVTTNNLLNTAP